MSKIFIDSSVLIAACISKTGSARQLIVSSFKSKHEIYISNLVFEETMHNLSDKVPAVVPVFRLLQTNFPFRRSKPSKKLILKVSKSIEWKDAPIVAAAIEIKADYLVTFDKKHLLSKKDIIKNKYHLKVITPDELI